MMGRMTQAGGYAMLVELYLNAEVWTGTPRWDDCIAAADKLITSQAGGQNGTMQLDANIEDQFKPTNDLSKEVIFSLVTDYKLANTQPSWPSEFYHFKQQEIYGGGRNGNDGIVEARLDMSLASFDIFSFATSFNSRLFLYFCHCSLSSFTSSCLRWS